MHRGDPDCATFHCWSYSSAPLSLLQSVWFPAFSANALPSCAAGAWAARGRGWAGFPSCKTHPWGRNSTLNCLGKQECHKYFSWCLLSQWHPSGWRKSKEGGECTLSLSGCLCLVPVRQEQSGGDDQPELTAEFDLLVFIVLFLMSLAFWKFPLNV